MNEFSLIFNFLAEGDAEVQGRSVKLETEDAGLIARVSSGNATEKERQQAALLMRDSEEALLQFVKLISTESTRSNLTETDL